MLAETDTENTATLSQAPTKEKVCVMEVGEGSIGDHSAENMWSQKMYHQPDISQEDKKQNMTWSWYMLDISKISSSMENK